MFTPAASSTFLDIKILVREDGETEVRRLLGTTLFSFPSASIEVISISREYEDWGTADVLRQYGAKITVSLFSISNLCQYFTIGSSTWTNV